VISPGDARARLLGFLAGRGRVRGLEVFPQAKVDIARSAELDIAGRLRLGSLGHVGRYSPSHARFDPGSRTTVRGQFSVYSGFSLLVGAGAELELGSGFFNHGARIVCGARISIGDKCWFGPEVMLRDDDEHAIAGGTRTAPIVIGNNIWVGARAIILKGVTIGDGAIVAAGAVVAKDVPPRTLVAGVPARVVRKEVSWQ